MKNKKILYIISAAAAATVALIIGVIVLFNSTISPMISYASAKKHYAEGNIPQAAILYGKAGDYKKSDEFSISLWDTFAQRKTSVYNNSIVMIYPYGGKVFSVSDINKYINTSGWEDIIAVDAGSSHVIGLKADGSVVASGDNKHHQLNVYNKNWKNIVDVAATSFNSFGLKSDGTIVTSTLAINEKIYYKDWKNIIDIDGGSFHLVGLKADGTVVATPGPHATAEEDIACQVESWRDIVAIFADDYYTIGLKSDGTVVATGTMFDSSDFSDWRNIVSLTAHGDLVVGIKDDGTVVVNSDRPLGWNNIVQVSTGGGVAGITADGKLVALTYDSIQDHASELSSVDNVCCTYDTIYAICRDKVYAIDREGITLVNQEN